MGRFAIRLLVIVGVCLAACGSSDDTETIYGIWHLGYYEAYETFESDGTWSVAQGVYAPSYDWGTYTLEDGVLTMNNADGSLCSGASVVFEVAFSEDGNELHETLVSDTCVKDTVRARDRVLVRYTP